MEELTTCAGVLLDQDDSMKWRRQKKRALLSYNFIYFSRCQCYSRYGWNYKQKWLKAQFRWRRKMHLSTILVQCSILQCLTGNVPWCGHLMDGILAQAKVDCFLDSNLRLSAIIQEAGGDRVTTGIYIHNTQTVLSGCSQSMAQWLQQEYKITVDLLRKP